MGFVLLVHAVQNIGYCTQMLLESESLSIGFSFIILMQNFYLLRLTLFFCCVILRLYSCKRHYINIIFFLSFWLHFYSVKSLMFSALMTDCCLTCITVALDTCYLSGFLYFAVWYTALSKVLFIDLCIPMALTVTLVTECNFKQFFRIQH